MEQLAQLVSEWRGDEGLVGVDLRLGRVLLNFEAMSDGLVHALVRFCAEKGVWRARMGRVQGEGAWGDGSWCCSRERVARRA